ncbi:unnamed protein product [Acanthosepion pharaonis]|uniref:Reverse transcriptase domain-containing protein n=1 Tax=Acanthosepion pharaonis TaxID=158019 RepID=A0A812EM83_ACAPH|nr:unnamed protein product [Sepia pharaonis]
MRHDGFPSKLLNLIKAYYAQTRTRVRCYGEESDSFVVRTGVRQGCLLSPILFSYIIAWILENSMVGLEGVRVGHDCNITDFDYVDDVAILSESYVEVQHALDEVSRMVKMVGMKINASKTKIFSANFSLSDRVAVTLDGEAVEEVESFKYLGANFTATGQAKDEIPTQTHPKASFSFSLSLSLYLSIYLSISLSIYIYEGVPGTLSLSLSLWPLY